MKKTAIVLALTSVFATNAMADGVTGGVELDAKFVNGAAEYKADNGSGIKAFIGYEGFGASAKRKANFENEYNLNYTHDFGNIWLKGEYEFVDKKSRQQPANDQNKFGVTVGGNVADLFDTSLRLRKDTDLNSNTLAPRGDIYRFDLAAGKQVTERVYLNAKVVGQKQNKKEAITVGDKNKDSIYNLELRATFTAIDNMIPYVEVGNEGKFGTDTRNTYGKVGVVFPF
ncbi:hypothetical protein C9980_11100 [Vibrio mediterranei]|jgi:hypothetical protein|uniref:Porin n=1 Tax=Vibrio mediterranei TaxID=689 RepID=A0ABX5DEG5_9VIBR|nr:hypothetical protein [Vibrio mediterranei]MCG9663239.1 hypothetical protein [Vibrio mediterranei]PCD89555.1 hypothetical protein COR52_06440 [Vibrio mediterranei]PRQ68084.1 hypothetical protein COR51_06385 [Vibrio mediterranei]PTC04838.1 hypothetical protein C9980_11100 [Vibrio mediterranei]